MHNTGVWSVRLSALKLYISTLISTVPKREPIYRVPTPTGKSGIFSLKFQDLEVLENHFGPGKSWKNILKNYAVSIGSKNTKINRPHWETYSAP